MEEIDSLTKKALIKGAKGQDLSLPPHLDKIQTKTASFFRDPFPKTGQGKKTRTGVGAKELVNRNLFVKGNFSKIYVFVLFCHAHAPQ